MSPVHIKHLMLQGDEFKRATAAVANVMQAIDFFKEDAEASRAAHRIVSQAVHHAIIEEAAHQIVAQAVLCAIGEEVTCSWLLIMTVLCSVLCLGDCCRLLMQKLQQRLQQRRAL